MKEETFTQQTFNVLMQAMSRPGTIHQLEPREGCPPFMYVLLTLLDHEVTFAVVGEDFISDHIATATGAREAATDEADYLLVQGGDSAGAVLRAKRGDLRYPDRGATIIYMVRSLQGSSMNVRLTGPGISREQYLAVDGLSPGEVVDITAANASFPMGVDCILVDDAARTASVPRSARMEVT